MGKVGHMPLTQSTLPLPLGVGEGEASGLSPCLWPQLDSWFRLKEAGGPTSVQELSDSAHSQFCCLAPHSASGVMDSALPAGPHFSLRAPGTTIVSGATHVPSPAQLDDGDNRNNPVPLAQK